MTTKLARSALWYARLGWHIFPLRPRTKEPFGKLGLYNATCDTDQVIDWWQRWPEANIGLNCGASGILGLDLDAYKDAYQGASLLTADEHETVINLTGSGGSHLLYAMPEGVKYTNATGNLPAGIDVRGYGGYLVLPPSIHPNGTPYRWEIGYGPHEVPLLPLPHSLRSILDDARAHQRVAGPPDSEAVQVALQIVEQVFEDMDIAAEGPTVYDGDGRKWILPDCPFNPSEAPHGRDRSAFVIIARDGHISAGCHHARCREQLKEGQCGGWKWIIKQWSALHV
jgi:hypothetical protein